MVTVCIPDFESISCPIVLSFYYSFYLADRCAIWYILNPGKFFSVGACMSRDFDIFMSKHLAGQWLLNSYIYSFKFSSLFSTFTDFDEQQIRPLRHSRFPLLPACLNGRICFHISVLFFSCFFIFSQSSFRLEIRINRISCKIADASAATYVSAAAVRTFFAPCNS